MRFPLRTTAVLLVTAGGCHLATGATDYVVESDGDKTPSSGVGASGGGAQSCDTCIQVATAAMGLCEPSVAACASDADCSAYLTCIGACADDVCQQDCQMSHPLGAQLSADITECTCESACAAQCVGHSSCPPPPTCGFISEMPACQACFETSCCSVLLACADDNLCVACITTLSPNKPARCANYPLADAVLGCVRQSCPAEC